MKGKKDWVLQGVVGWNIEKWLLFIKSCFHFFFFFLTTFRVFTCCHIGAPPPTRIGGTKPHKNFTFPKLTFAACFLFCFHDNRSCCDELGWAVVMVINLITDWLTDCLVGWLIEWSTVNMSWFSVAAKFQLFPAEGWGRWIFIEDVTSAEHFH